jgi:hypothetical protein
MGAAREISERPVCPRIRAKPKRDGGDVGRKRRACPVQRAYRAGFSRFHLLYSNLILVLAGLLVVFTLTFEIVFALTSN